MAKVIFLYAYSQNNKSIKHSRQSARTYYGFRSTSRIDAIWPVVYVLPNKSYSRGEVITWISLTKRVKFAFFALNLGKMD